MCIGFQKCGTTSLYDILRQHKKIYLTEGVKEPMFYRVPLLRPCLGKKWYEKRYFGRFRPESGQTPGEINAGLSFRGCADKIGRDFPKETRLIFSCAIRRTGAIRHISISCRWDSFLPDGEG